MAQAIVSASILLKEGRVLPEKGVQDFREKSVHDLCVLIYCHCGTGL